MTSFASSLDNASDQGPSLSSGFNISAQGAGPGPAANDPSFDNVAAVTPSQLMNGVKVPASPEMAYKLGLS
ncbi:MAG: hypothetical protein H6862_04850 [Rhodospirillales bacterium]|nr:hypothetical protein [Rhodospirillales bacterium]